MSTMLEQVPDMSDRDGENTEVSTLGAEVPRSLVETDKIPGMPDNIFNVGAWEEIETTVDEEGIEAEKRVIYLLGRLVVAAAEEGKPDVGSLVLLTLGPDGVESTTEVWQPKEGEPTLEDARVQRLADGRLAIGLTSVAQEGEGYIPYPAVLITSTAELKQGKLPEPDVIKAMGMGGEATPLGEGVSSLAGKNVTAFGPDLFAFRQEGEQNNHRLTIFDYKDGEARHKQFLDIPTNIPWAKIKGGTTFPPIWLNESEAFIMIHGITYDENGLLVYSIGSARLLKDENGVFTIDNVSEEPLIHPDLFVGLLNKEAGDNDAAANGQAELHSKRRVAYLCGATHTLDANGRLENVVAYVGAGDRRTFRDTIDAAWIIEGWVREELSVAA